MQNKTFVFIQFLAVYLMLSPAKLFANDSAVTYSSIPALDCVINPYRVADVASPVAGVIDEINVQRSQQVIKGQQLAQLKAGVERANVELAKFRSHIKTEIELSQVNLTFDQRRKSRINSLKQQQAISEESDDEARREANISKWKLQQAREISRVRKLELGRAIEQLQQKTIKAPFSGFVLDTFKEQGEYVDDQAILRLAQLDPLVVEAIVPMENFGAISVGMQAEIVPEVLIDEKLQAKVTIVDRVGDTASNTFGVRLVLPNTDHKIPAGLKCIVKFVEPQEVIAEPGEDEYEEKPGNIQLLQEKPHLKLEHSKSTETTTPALVQPISSAASGYLVVTEQKKTSTATRELLLKLKSSGVEDVLEMDHGPYSGLILLGLFNNRDDAVERQQAIQALGFNVYVKERHQPSR